MDEYKIPVKIRVCDTMGYGVNFPGAVIPRSIPGIIYGLMVHAGVPSELIEFHGHNDFIKQLIIQLLHGFTEQQESIVPYLGLESVQEIHPSGSNGLRVCAIRGTLDGMDTTVITELAEYYEKEIGYTVPSRTPFVGKEF